MLHGGLHLLSGLHNQPVIVPLQFEPVNSAKWAQRKVQKDQKMEGTSKPQCKPVIVQGFYTTIGGSGLPSAKPHFIIMSLQCTMQSSATHESNTMPTHTANTGQSAGRLMPRWPVWTCVGLPPSVHNPSAHGENVSLCLLPGITIKSRVTPNSPHLSCTARHEMLHAYSGWKVPSQL